RSGWSAAGEDFGKNWRVDIAAGTYHRGTFAGVALALSHQARQCCRARSFDEVMRVRIVDAYCFGDLVLAQANDAGRAGEDDGEWLRLGIPAGHSIGKCSCGVGRHRMAGFERERKR